MRVVSFESRRAKEIAELIRHHGGEPMTAPALREVAMSENPAAMEFAGQLARGELDVVVFLTGVGTRYLAGAIESVLPREPFGGALRRVVTVARGPKPVTALWELFQLRPTISVGEPNTWRELLAATEAKIDLRGKRVAVQEYGQTNPELLEGLAARGAEVRRVPVYHWALPEDTQPLRDAIAQILGGRIQVAIFTSATQVEHLVRVAAGDAEPLREALTRVVIASIGPLCSQALKRVGLYADIEPEHPKMGSLVTAVADRAPAMVAAKRGVRG